MLSYVARRALYMVFVVWIVSVVAFVIINLPPGDWLTSYIMQLEGQGVDPHQIEQLRSLYGLDQPWHARYLHWMSKVLRGDFGMSFQWRTPVSELIAEALPITVGMSVLTLLFVYAVAIPVGIYSATHQYSLGDYSWTVVGFVGLAIPNFLLALVLMFLSYKWFGVSVGGLFSPEYVDAPWTTAKIFDLLKHMPVPILVVGMSGTAGIIRVMRGCLLDELRKQYVITARAKGVSENTLLFKYPVRVSLNPIISSLGWILPSIVSGETITAVVLSLPTMGALLFQALMAQDMFLSGSIVLLQCVLVIVGMFISDLLLSVVDPRIRFEK